MLSFLNKLFCCSSVWGNTSQQNIKKLQSVQNFAARIISGTRKFDHITPVLNQLQWLPVKHQIRFRDNLVFKYLNRLAPDYLREKFHFRSKVHNRNTRNCNQLNILKYRLTNGQRTFTYRGVKVWNERDNSIVCISQRAPSLLQDFSSNRQRFTVPSNSFFIHMPYKFIGRKFLRRRIVYSANTRHRHSIPQFLSLS